MEKKIKSDGAVCGIKMGEEFEGSGVGNTKVVVSKFRDRGGWDSLKNLFLSAAWTAVCLELAVDFGYLVLGGCSGMVKLVAWVMRWDVLDAICRSGVGNGRAVIGGQERHFLELT